MPGEFDRPEFQAAVKRILTAGLHVGCPAGIHIVEPDTDHLKASVKEGYKFIAYSVDIRMLDVAARAGAKIINEVNMK